MFFTIIVPIYKVEQYLPMCIDSILAQTYKNFELILIDDGSPDKCPDICDEYAELDTRIKVIHQNNSGLSAARNAGIDIAHGDYLVFVDSDDWIEPDSLNGFSKAIEQYNYPDVIETILTDCNEDGSSESSIDIFAKYINENGFGKESALNWKSKIATDKWPAPKMILKLDFVNAYKLRFRIGRIHEDIIWTPTVCNFATSFGSYVKPWYNYRKNRQNSITNEITPDNIFNQIINSREIFSMYLYYSTETLLNFYYSSLVSLYYTIRKLQYNKSNIDSVAKMIDGNMCIFNPRYAIKKKHKLFAVLIHLIGPRNSLLLLSRLNK